MALVERSLKDQEIYDFLRGPAPLADKVRLAVRYDRPADCRYLLQTYLRKYENEEDFDEIFYSGNLSCIQETLQYKDYFEKGIMYAAARGHFSAVLFMKENNYPGWIYASHGAASTGQINCLRRITEYGFPKTIGALSWAAKMGQIESCRFLIAEGYPTHRSAIVGAANNGHLDCVKVLTEAGCEKCPSASLCAAAKGHYQCLKYMIENDWPISRYAVQMARRNLHHDCETLLKDNGFFDLNDD